MGEKLASYFDKAKEKGGLEAQVKFAMLTRMSQSKAKDAEDSPENIALFEDSLSKI